MFYHGVQDCERFNMLFDKELISLGVYVSPDQSRLASLHLNLLEENPQPFVTKGKDILDFLLLTLTLTIDLVLLNYLNERLYLEKIDDSDL